MCVPQRTIQRNHQKPALRCVPRIFEDGEELAFEINGSKLSLLLKFFPSICMKRQSVGNFTIYKWAADISVCYRGASSDTSHWNFPVRHRFRPLNVIGLNSVVGICNDKSFFFSYISTTNEIEFTSVKCGQWIGEHEIAKYNSPPTRRKIHERLMSLLRINYCL